MNSLVVGDGLLARQPGTKDLAMALPLEQLGGKSSDAVEHLTSADPSEQANDYLVLGRSACAIAAGLDVSRTPELAVVHKDNLFVPISFAAHKPVGEKLAKWLENNAAKADAGDIVSVRKRQIPIGRILAQKNLIKLTPEEIEAALADNLIGLGAQDDSMQPDHRLTPDGIAVPIAPWELVTHDKELQAKDSLLKLLLHGRRFVTPLTETVARSEADKFGAFTVATALISPGSHFLKAVSASSPDGQLQQLEGAAWIDPDRTMGLTESLGPARRGHQVELVNSNPETSQQTWGDTLVNFEVYRPDPSSEAGSRTLIQPKIDWSRMTPNERSKIHTHGFNMAEIVDPMVEPLAAALSGDNCAIVITKNGITEVKDTGYAGFNARDIEYEASGGARPRTMPDNLSHLRPLCEKFELIANNPRLVVARNVDPNSIAKIVQSADLEGFIVLQDSVPAVTGDEHSVLLNLARQGRMIGWIEPDGDFRVLHRSGVGVLPSDIEKFENLELVFAMYGSHHEHVGKKLLPEIKSFIGRLTAAGFDKESLGFIHGDGPGVMRAADRAARAMGAMSIGVGMHFEDIGQGRDEDQNPQARILFDHLSRLPRQQILLETSDIQIYHEGGWGTIAEEFGMAATSTKLYNFLPLGFHMIDNNGLYAPTRRQADLLARKGLVDKWVTRSIHVHPDHEAAFNKISEIYRNPAAYWSEIGIQPENIEIAYKNRLRTLAAIGRRMPATLQRGALEYIASS